jgi:hemolysin III
MVIPQPGGYTTREEIAHSVTAALGMIAALAAVPWLILTAALHGEGIRGGAVRLIGAIAFGCGALLMFGTSTLYHTVSRPGAKVVLRRLDHSAIYVLIAGTYTPFAIGVVRGNTGWLLFAAVWTLALAGVAVKMSGRLRIPLLSTALYLGMGWIGVLVMHPLIAGLTASQLGWVVAGGLCYTGGVPFYLWKRRRYAHAVWHVFVLAGVACHFVAILSVLRGAHA